MCMMTTERTSTIALKRFELSTDRAFADVLATLHDGLGHPDFAALMRTLATAPDWDAYRALVAEPHPERMQLPRVGQQEIFVRRGTVSGLLESR